MLTKNSFICEYELWSKSCFPKRCAKNYNKRFLFRKNFSKKLFFSEFEAAILSYYSRTYVRAEHRGSKKTLRFKKKKTIEYEPWLQDLY